MSERTSAPVAACENVTQYRRLEDLSEAERAELALVELRQKHAEEVWNAYDLLSIHTHNDPCRAELEPKIEAARQADGDAIDAVEEVRERLGLQPPPWILDDFEPWRAPGLTLQQRLDAWWKASGEGNVCLRRDVFMREMRQIASATGGRS